MAPGVCVAQPTCDELADYTYFDANYPLDQNNEYHVTTDITWDVDMNVHGHIIVEEGRTLTIEYATIRFADSREMDHRTTIRVMPSAHLIVRHWAVLTTLEFCPESMWDGIMVMGVPSASEASGAQGTVDVFDGGRIEKAWVGIITGYCWDAYAWPLDPVMHTGGIVRCENAWFVNNVYSVVLRPYNPKLNGGETETHFFGCSFLVNGELPGGGDTAPAVQLRADGVGHLRVGGCTFANSYGPYHYTDASLWGQGVVAYSTSISILPLCDGQWTGLVPCEEPAIRTPNVFRGWLSAAGINSAIPGKFVNAVRCIFSENIRGLNLTGITHSTVVSNEVHVPLDPSDTGTPRGITFSASTGFEVQENEIGGPAINDFSLPCIGMYISNSGDGPNMFYRNRFRDKLTVGTIIQGDNDGPDPGDGLQFMCNDYAYDDVPDQYDIAFTGSNVSVGDKQGANIDASTPAGNTFSPACGNPENHLWAPQTAPNLIFDYWHHDPFSTTEIVKPECRSGSIPDGWFHGDIPSYNNPLTCQSQTDLFTGGGGEVVMLEAEQNHALLKEVYDTERDGGDTEGLKMYVADPAHSSYDVRNQLMLAAPKVSSDVWALVFARQPALNPWHLAQALLANVPLQPEVTRMLEESDIDPYYRQLVEGAQGNGISDLTIMESEMGHWLNRRERALNALAKEALMDGSDAALQAALDRDAAHPQYGLPVNRLALLMAKGEYTDAQAIVDDLLLVPEPDGAMEVLSIYLDLAIAGQGLHEVSTSDRALLQTLAYSGAPGQAQARAWLEALGEGPFPDELILPGEDRAMPWREGRAPAPLDLLAAFPNPSDGKQPVYVVVRLPEGMEQATLRIVDPAGRIIRDQFVAQQATIVELEASTLTKGLYLGGLYADGVQLASLKFEIVR